MSAQPTFSVIVPTRGRPRLLERALLSILAQQFTGYEVIVADDGSGEGAALARTLTSARFVTFTTGGIGQVATRNLALARACGRYVAWLDDDDWWDDACYLARLASVFERAPHVFAYSCGRIIWEDEAGRRLSILPFTARADASSLARNNELLISGVAYRRALHDRLGAFDERLAFYWDWDWYLRVAATEVPFVPTQSNGVRISVRTDNLSSARNAAHRRAQLARLQCKHGLGSIQLKNHATIAEGQAERPSFLLHKLRLFSPRIKDAAEKITRSFDPNFTTPRARRSQNHVGVASPCTHPAVGAVPGRREEHAIGCKPL